MAVRCDITSVVYAIWLGAFLVLGRQNSSIVWPVYVGFLAVLLPLQYLLVLGWPPALCLGENILVLISFHKALVKRNLKRGCIRGILLALRQNVTKITIKSVPSLKTQNAPGTPRGISQRPQTISFSNIFARYK